MRIMVVLDIRMLLKIQVKVKKMKTMQMTMMMYFLNFCFWRFVEIKFVKWEFTFPTDHDKHSLLWNFNCSL